MAQGRGRLRVLWRGAMVKGRGARASWHGKARFENARILRTEEINAWNPDRLLQREGENSVTWSSVTAGNFGAFDAWLEEGEDPVLVLDTNHAKAEIPLSEVGGEDVVVPAGGLDLELRVFRLPDRMQAGPLSGEVQLPLSTDRDNPLWIRVTTEDGFQAWTSPVYLIPES